MSDATPIQTLIVNLLRENTGVHMCDSGGENGRMWQQNMNRDVADFEAEPEATLEIFSASDMTCTVSVYHLMKEWETDELCDEFNAMPVNDWNSDAGYGVSEDGAAWLAENNLKTYPEKAVNTYNHESNLSQVLQYVPVHHKRTGEWYVLVQVHGGADVRGGYTDAKLFHAGSDEVSIYYMMSGDASFTAGDYTLSCGTEEWFGHALNDEGETASEDYREKFALCAGLLEEKNSVTMTGSFFPTC